MCVAGATARSIARTPHCSLLAGADLPLALSPKRSRHWSVPVEGSYNLPGSRARRASGAVLMSSTPSTGRLLRLTLPHVRTILLQRKRFLVYLAVVSLLLGTVPARDWQYARVWLFRRLQ